MSRLVLAAAVLAAAAAVLVPAAMAGMGPLPLTTVHSAKLGAVVTTHEHLALYTWSREKDKRVHCTGACAKIWPPILLEKGTKVAAHAKGIMGTFGTIKRPDGTTQLTWDGRPVYTFHGDTATKILCNGVDGWYVVKA
jgi:predicted lipoprotein with Yx(FWY)xxD motif